VSPTSPNTLEPEPDLPYLAPALKAPPPIAQRVALPVESLQHPLSVYDELLEVMQ
jgi:hypothetical protein